MRFRVTIAEKEGPRDPNPFKPLRWQDFPTRKTRTWEIDAESEEQVRAFWDDAQRQRLPHVVGFELLSITPMDFRIPLQPVSTGP